MNTVKTKPESQTRIKKEKTNIENLLEDNEVFVGWNKEGEYLFLDRRAAIKLMDKIRNERSWKVNDAA
ncbi:hypothetical protein [Leptospira sanjuanensis]|uniref:hypothetical protein n=1 Tax=Leptospira sanjuanensis TaxID=2879643 RepID=UPI001EE8D583|nr:hypothetical protein [Leptospira sanjuanensis]MCG6170259.1 hypothetical protein [Leptospira sanjuanensis]